jgi:hypothetical protein
MTTHVGTTQPSKKRVWTTYVGGNRKIICIWKCFKFLNKKKMIMTKVAQINFRDNSHFGPQYATHRHFDLSPRKNYEIVPESTFP